MENGTVREVSGFLCEVWSESAEGEILSDVRIELSEEGIVLTEGVGQQPNRDAPAAELSGWESGRLLQLGFNAEESLRGGCNLLEQVSRFANIGTSRSTIARFIRESELEVYCSRGGSVCFVGCAGTIANDKAATDANTHSKKERTANSEATAKTCSILTADAPRVIALQPGESICLASENVRTCIPLARVEEICQSRYTRIANADSQHRAYLGHQTKKDKEHERTHNPALPLENAHTDTRPETIRHSTNSAREIARVVRCYGETGSIAVAVITRICSAYGSTLPRIGRHLPMPAGTNS